jgi:hypothetical protein
MASISTDRISGSLYYDEEIGDWLIEPVRPTGSTFSPLAQIFRPIPQPPPAQPIACAVCLAQDSFSQIGCGVSIRRAVSTKMRCQEHSSACAYCLAECSSDKFLLCERCCDSGAASSVYEALDKANYARLESENRLCRLDSSVALLCQENYSEKLIASLCDTENLWACGCVTCISNTSAFYVALSLEEGSASSSASSLSSIELDSSHVGFQITESLLTP